MSAHQIAGLLGELTGKAIRATIVWGALIFANVQLWDLRHSLLVLEPGVCRHGAQALVGTLKAKTDDCHPGLDEARKKELDDALGNTERY